MFGMSNEQLLGLLRQFLPVLGTILGTLGWVKPENWATSSAIIMSVAGAALVIISAIWSLIDKTKASIVAKADALPEVAGVIMNQSAAGQVLASSIPSQTVVPAGTVAATVVAKGGTGL